MTKDVFISHSSKDSKVAQDICTFLEEREISCWIAPRDVTPGKSFGEEIIDAISETHATVLILSENSNNSLHVINEVERAVAKGKPIFPVRVRNVLPSKALELFISSSNWLDAWEPPIEQKANQLAAAIGAMLNRTTLKRNSQNGGANDKEKLADKKLTVPTIRSVKFVVLLAILILVVMVFLLLRSWREIQPSVELAQTNIVKDTVQTLLDQKVAPKSHKTTETQKDFAVGNTAETEVKRNAALAKAALTELVQFWAELMEKASTQDEKAKVRSNFANKFQKISTLPPELKESYIDYMLQERKYLTEQEYVVEVIRSAKDMIKVNAGMKWLKEKAFKEMKSEK